MRSRDVANQELFDYAAENPGSWLVRARVVGIP
jgi:hypothetical protein